MRDLEGKEGFGYCYECQNDNAVGHWTKIHYKTVVLGVPVETDYLELICDKCGGPLTSDEAWKVHDLAVYNAYKKKVGLLTTDEIKQIRQKRGWSQRQLAKFLDIGEKDITRYENGSLQTRCIDNLIRLVGDDEVFEEMCRCLHKTYVSKIK